MVIETVLKVYSGFPVRQVSRSVTKEASQWLNDYFCSLFTKDHRPIIPITE